jgi:Fe-S-cluster containining protein
VDDELDRQVERGSLFTHTALSQTAERLTEVESMVYGLVDVLLSDGKLDEERFERAAASARSELDTRGETVSPGVALRFDGEIPQGAFTPVDCEKRLPICHAVCCRLHFALSAGEVEGGVAKWDLGQPYFIRQGASGSCVHNDPETGACGIYAERPGVCKRYTCAHDERIWSDFEKMELNQAWIDQNLSPAAPRLASASMMAFESSPADPASSPADPASPTS